MWRRVLMAAGLVAVLGTAAHAEPPQRLASADIGALAPAGLPPHLLEPSFEDAPAGRPKAPPEETRRPAATPRQGAPLTIVLVGDTGLNGGMQPVHPDGALKHGRRHAWADLTARIRSEINGDLNFANLETVVTDRSDLRPEPKSFNFRTHSEGVRHLVRLGFNLFSTANNHSGDYGPAGMRDTLRHLERLRDEGLLAHAGLGVDRKDAARPRLVTVRDETLAFSAFGIVTRGFAHHRAGEARPGQLSYHAPEDIADILGGLRATGSAYRILSVHHGAELAVMADAAAVQRFRHQAVKAYGVDLVVGHHAHVVAGIERVDGRLIFYGLGNFLHPGTQDMAKFGLCRDYGLIARVHLARAGKGRLVAKAVEIVPIRGTHLAPQRLPAAQAVERIEVVNYLARFLDAPGDGAVGVRFRPQADGSGLYCTADAAAEPGRIGSLCGGWRPPAPMSTALERRIRASCGGAHIARRRAMPTQRTAGRTRPASRTTSRPPSIFSALGFGD
ncbi:MAG: CapA family protein [Hyphomicrobiaceae bacterium]